MNKKYSIGWDVGGWHCDKNKKSRDAIVILDSDLQIVGRPWRGNLRNSINDSVGSGEWLEALFDLCKENAPRDAKFVMAIDAVLGFSEEFLELASGLKIPEKIGEFDTNPYLFRQTERHLFKRGLKPLSAIKDMIGSQATKGIHAVAKFTPDVESCGVWTDGDNLRVIETYPAGSIKEPAVRACIEGCKPLGHSDLDDARICALVAYLFGTQISTLDAPPLGTSNREGWIWIPKQETK